MRIAIVGSRSYPSFVKLADFIDCLAAEDWVVSGGAQGVDDMARKLALARGLTTLTFPARWKKFGKRAGYIRNELIIYAADIVIAFWDGKSKGTLDTMCKAVKYRKPIAVYVP